ncbi:MAG: hydroxyacylglutathione hydrolase [Alphaproteobacteria bacterium]
MSRLDIHLCPALSDNYVHLLHDASSGATAAVDPGEEEPVLRAIAQRGWTLTHILITHHHADHTGGAVALKEATGCRVVGTALDARRIEGGLDIALAPEEHFALGCAMARMMAVPGHTSGHVAWWFPESTAVFCGDTLFAGGCGRLFEGTAEQMWESLRRLRDLPEDTRVYCGHEYTLANLRFAVTMDPGNPALRTRLADVEAERSRRLPTVPSLIREERATNPFLRADTDALRISTGLPPGSRPADVFAEIRRRKDRF